MTYVRRDVAIQMMDHLHHRHVRHRRYSMRSYLTFMTGACLLDLVD